MGALVGTVSSAISGNGTAGYVADVNLGQVPIVLFVWGIGRIVPVRVTSLTITEKLYDVALNPTYAEAQISMTVLTPQDLGDLQGPLATVALAANDYTLALRQVARAREPREQRVVHHRHDSLRERLRCFSQAAGT